MVTLTLRKHTRATATSSSSGWTFFGSSLKWLEVIPTSTVFVLSGEIEIDLPAPAASGTLGKAGALALECWSVAFSSLAPILRRCDPMSYEVLRVLDLDCIFADYSDSIMLRPFTVWPLNTWNWLSPSARSANL